MAGSTPSADHLVGICHSHFRVRDPHRYHYGSRRYPPSGRSGQPMRDVLVVDDDLYERTTVRGALDGLAADYLIKPFEFPQLRAKLEAFRTRADTLESAVGADQSLVDSLFGGPITRPQRPVLPKGLSEETGWLVLDAVRAAGELCAAECSDQVGISRVSARRFLETICAPVSWS